MGLLYCGQMLYRLNCQGSRNPPSETPKILSGTLVQKGFGLISLSLRILKHKFGRSKPLWAGIRLKVDRDVFWDRWAEHGCELKLFLPEVLVLGGCWTVSHGSLRVQAEYMLLWLLSFAQASSSCSWTTGDSPIGPHHKALVWMTFPQTQISPAQFSPNHHVLPRLGVFSWGCWGLPGVSTNARGSFSRISVSYRGPPV